MKVEFRRSFSQDLKKVRDRLLMQKIKTVIEAVETAISLNEVPNIKQLKGGNDYFRIRVGDYRIGLILQDNTLVFVRMIHRKEFYRYFP